MDFYDILLAKKLNGEGGGDSTGIIVTEETLPNGGIVKHIEGQVISGTKQISSNGEFDVAAYKSVNVNVSGGGGGSLSNPTATFTIVNSTSTEMVFSYYEENENRIEEKWLELAGYSTTTITPYLIYSDLVSGYTMFTDYQFTITDTVNCVDNHGTVLVTDPTATPISAILTY